MLAQLRKKLEGAEGRSEFIIAVVCDIRGFSSFSRSHESPDTAMFIKRFYLKLLNIYFAQAVFAKPTGDGLLLVFRYSEHDLDKVAEYVLTTCFATINDFPAMFADDPMINFTTPANLGYGIARGTACCLFSGRQIIDYSGQLLNLAARLNDFARPRGVVLDGSFLSDVIPEDLRSRFKKKPVYVRGIAEDAPIDVFYSASDVSLPSYALFPIQTYEWRSEQYDLTVSQLNKLPGNLRLALDTEPMTPDRIKVDFAWPHQKLDGFTTSREYDTFTYSKDASGPHLTVQLDKAKNYVMQEKLTQKTKVYFQMQYVPKIKAKGKKRRT